MQNNGVFVREWVFLCVLCSNQISICRIQSVWFFRFLLLLIKKIGPFFKRMDVWRISLDPEL